MKRALPIFVIFLFFIHNVYSQAAPPDAGSYLEQMGIEYEKISQEMMGYISAVNHGKSARKIDKRRGELLVQVKNSERTVRQMKPFKGDSKLRDSIASYFKLTYIILNEDYGKIMNLEDIAEQSYDAMEAYMLAKELAGKKMDSSHAVASRQYESFASANNIRLIEGKSKLSEKMKAAAKVNEYYSKIYLLFFKSYKNEAYLMDAFSREDVVALEQTRSTLEKSATEDGVVIGKMASFNSDPSLKNACQQFLTFYKYESGKTTELIDFFVSKQNFDKVRKAFEAKRQNDRTQADVDLYNKSVNEMNAKSKSFNSINDELNKKRSALIKQWNETSNSFLDKHTP